MKKMQVQNAKGEVRIIAGLWRGRKLPVLNAEGLRPTGDRVKETLFNWLMPYIVDSHCLDCFAGSGSLGFEALSRQAKQVTFLELDKTVANQLKKNLQTLKTTTEQAQVINQNSFSLCMCCEMSNFILQSMDFIKKNLIKINRTLMWYFWIHLFILA